MSAEKLEAFAAARRELTALAYRMLGDLARAEDMVQEAWLRFERHDEPVASTRAFLVTVVARLCLNELDSARARREESRADRLPEPVDLGLGGLDRLERLERISMAFLVLLQRLTPAERAVLLLHDVFDFDHPAIAELVGSNAPACRKLLERARKNVATERRLLVSEPAEHRRLLHAFVQAATLGDVASLAALLAKDAVMVSDGGQAGRTLFGVRNLKGPLEGAERIAAFVAATAARTRELALEVAERDLNGQPAIVFSDRGEPFAALLLAVAEGRIQRVYFHADVERLGHVGATPRRDAPS